MVIDKEASSEHSTIRRLYRSRVNKVISGVCGGIAEYFDVDPILIRIAWILITLFGGMGIIAYIVAIIIIPVNPQQSDVSETAPANSHDKAMLWGTILILLGSVLILRHFGLLYYFRFWNIPWQIIWAALLIIFGVFLIYNRNSGNRQEPSGGSGMKQFYRVPKNKMVSGVCSGLALYFDVDVTLVRLAWVVLSLASIGVGVLAYLIMVIVFPELPE